jgi:hypothetical protein
MLIIKTITIFDQTTGKFGPTFSGSEEDIADMLLLPHIDGAYDSTKYKVNLATMQVEEIAEAPKPLLHELRNARNEMLDNFRWTVMPDSPLTEGNKAEWLQWLKDLQGILVGITSETTDTVVWPTKPSYVYQT